MSNLFVATNGKVACLNPQTGEELWVTKLKSGELFSTTTYEDVSVLEENGNVFAGSNGHVFCLDARTGKQLWHNSLKGFGYNDVAMSIAGKAVVAKSPKNDN